MSLGTAPNAVETETRSGQLPQRLPCLSVSVLVPAWNEVEHIAACLESLLAIDWPRFEILVSAGGEDGTYEVAERYAGGQVILVRQQPGQGKQAALRDLLTRASGEVIYLTDADCVMPESTFRSVLDPIVRGEVSVVTGTYRPYRTAVDEPLIFYQWSIDRAVERRRGNQSDGMIGRNAAVARSALDAVGGFEPEVATGTDYHLARRLRAAGYVIRYVDAAVETDYAGSSRQLVRQRSRWLRNLLLHGPTFRDFGGIAATARTIGLSLGFLLWPLIWRRARLPGVLVWLAGFIYLVGARLRYANALATEMSQPIQASYVAQLPLYTLLDALASVWSLVDLMSRSRRRRW